LSGKQTICGEVNAKNGFGGYTGMTPFIYFADTNRATTIETDSRKLRRVTDQDYRIAGVMINDLGIYIKDCMQ
jgi:hypothetical protein